MSTALVVKPDTSFIRSVIRSGGEDLKKCYQCATCSAVCDLAPEGAPFPRKQMIEAQWGMKDRLVGDPALWLCHNCGQCTKRCPRGARPGDVLGALRREVIRHFAFPGFMGALVSGPRAWPVLFLLPVLIFAGIALTAGPAPGSGPLEFANLFPIPVLEALFFAVSGFVVLAMGVSLARFTRALRAGGAAGSIRDGFLPALKLAATNERLTGCEGERQKFWGHMLTMWGFGGLALVGTVVGLGTMFGVMHTPLAASNPCKIFANLCAAVLLAGTLVLVAGRLKTSAARAAGTWFDWFFLLTLTGVVATGIASEALRIASAATMMYAVYFIHLVLILALFLYAPYSKFAHMLYRTVAIATVIGAEKRAASIVTAPAVTEGGA